MPREILRAYKRSQVVYRGSQIALLDTDKPEKITVQARGNNAL